MTATTKFSQFALGAGNYQYPLTSDIIVGLRGGINQQMSNAALTDTAGSLIQTYGLAASYGTTYNGTGAIALPVGTTAQRPSAVHGAIRQNTTTGFFECSVNGTTWVDLATGGGGITIVNGTANQIDVSTVGNTSTISLDPALILPGTLTTSHTVTLSGLTAFTIVGLDTSKNVTSISNGTAGQVLTSNGPGSQPTFQSITGSGWIDQTTTPVTLAAGSSYVADNAGAVTFNMPATVPFGTEFEIRGQGAGGWIVQFNGGQTGHLNSTSTTSGGTFASTERYDCLSILCTVANTTFVCTSSGVITNT